MDKETVIYGLLTSLNTYKNSVTDICLKDEKIEDKASETKSLINLLIIDLQEIQGKL